MAQGRKRKETQSDEKNAAAGKKQKSPKQEDEEASPDNPKTEFKVHPDRVRELRGGEIQPGPVIYWCDIPENACPNAPDSTLVWADS